MPELLLELELEMFAQYKRRKKNTNDKVDLYSY